MTRIAGIAAFALLATACQPTLKPVALTSSTEGCFQEIPISEQLVAESNTDNMTSFDGSDFVPEFLVGHLGYLRFIDRDPPSDDHYEPHGGVLYIRTADGDWRAVLPQEGEASVGVWVSPNSPDVYMLSQLQVEGPGQSFTLTRSTDGLQTAACVVINFPQELNEPNWAMEYVTPAFLQINRRAKGELVGSAELGLETDKTETAWYRYTTEDGGATWSDPERLAAKPAIAAGPLVQVEAKAPPALVENLKAFAKGKPPLASPPPSPEPPPPAPPPG